MIIRRLFLYGFFVLGLIGFGILYLIATPQGLRTTIHITEKLVPGKLRVGPIEGRLYGPFVLNNVRYEDEYVNVKVGTVYLNWQPMNLFHGKVTVTHLYSNHVSVKVAQDTPPPETAVVESSNETHVKFPLTIELNQSKIQDVTIAPGSGNLTIHLGMLLTQGYVDLSQGLQWTVETQGENINPITQGSKLKSKNQFSIAIKGNLPEDYFLVNLKKLSGNLFGHPLQGKGLFEVKGGQYEFHNIYLQAGDAFVQAQGNLNNNWNLQWKIHVPKLQAINPKARGTLENQGTLKGNSNQPILDTTTYLHQLSWEDYQVEQLNSQIHLDFSPSNPSNIKITGQQIKLPGISFNTMGLQGRGTMASHQIKAQATQDNNHLNLQITGQRQGNTWLESLDVLTLQSKDYGQWHLSQPTKITLDKQTIDVPPLCMQSPLAKLCGQYHWQKQQGTTLSLNANDLQMSVLQAWLPPETKIHGKASFNVSYQDSLDKPQLGKVKMVITPGYVTYLSDKKPHRFDYEGGQLNATLDNTGLTASLYFDALKQRLISAQLDLPKLNLKEFDPAKQTISGQLNANLQNLGQLPDLSQSYSDLQGRFQAELTLTGTLDKPTLLGNANLSHGQVKIDPLGIHITHINGQLTGDRQHHLNYHLDMTSGGGQLTSKGNTLLDGKTFATKVNIDGQRFQVSNNRDAVAYISPKLLVDYVYNTLRLSGSVQVPEAKITPEDFSSTLEMPGDTVYLSDEGQEVESLPFNFYSDITVTLGNKVHFAYEGLDAQLSGQLTVHNTPEGITTANGQIGIKQGKFEAYGQKLDIRRGQLLYSGGPVTNPGLSIQATRKVKAVSNVTSSSGTAVPIQQTITAGLEITGSAETPQIKLFSVPGGYTQAQILSFLLLGRGLDSASAADGQSLAAAAMSMNLGGGEVSKIHSTIQNTLGLSELSVGSQANYRTDNSGETDVFQNTSLIIGKYLTPRLYVSLSIGLAEPINTLMVTYQLAKHWSFQTQTNNEASGLDLLYTVEQNKLRLRLPTREDLPNKEDFKELVNSFNLLNYLHEDKKPAQKPDDNS